MIKDKVILDTNVFLLFLIGLVDESYIEKFRRTKHYDLEDYKQLKKAISSFEKILITPQILSEFSHFTFKKSSKFRDEYKKSLKSILLKLEELDERYIELSTTLSNQSVYYLGITDVSLIELCKDDAVIITSDGPLADQIIGAGKRAWKLIPGKGFKDNRI